MRAPKDHPLWLCCRTSYSGERWSYHTRVSGDPPGGSIGLFTKRRTSFKWTAWCGCHPHPSIGEQLSPFMSCKEVLEAPMAALVEMGHGAETAGCLWSPESGARECDEATRIRGRTSLWSHSKRWYKGNHDFLVSQ